MVSYPGRFNAPVTITAATTTSDALSIQVTGDTAARLTMRGDGRLEMGGGVTPPGVTLYRDGSDRLHAGNTFLTEGDTQVDVAGRGMIIKEGANARSGTLTLTGATPVVVANTTVTANTRIYLTANAPGGTPGHFWVSARSAGVSFSVTGTAGDTSTLAYFMVEPA